MSYQNVLAEVTYPEYRHRWDPLDGTRALCGKPVSNVTPDKVNVDYLPVCSTCQWQENYLMSLTRIDQGLPDE